MYQLGCFPEYSLGGVGGVSYLSGPFSRFTAALLIFDVQKPSCRFVFRKVSFWFLVFTKVVRAFEPSASTGR